MSPLIVYVQLACVLLAAVPARCSITTPNFGGQTFHPEPNKENPEEKLIPTTTYIPVTDTETPYTCAPHKVCYNPTTGDLYFIQGNPFPSWMPDQCKSITVCYAYRFNTTIVDVDTIQNYIYGRAPTKIVTHGFQGDRNTYQPIVDKLLLEPNTIVLSYEWLVSSHLNQSEAAIASVYLGSTEVRTLIGVLNKRLHVKFEQFHLIGEGMGAHLMGAAARGYNGQIGRITGLDPWKRYFDDSSEFKLPKLTSLDATFVDIYHTNAGELGLEQAIGTVDFYISGGVRQPQCENNPSPRCNSLVAKEYFVESFTRKDSFKATRCDSYVDFVRRNCDQNPTIIAGEFTPTTAKGTYYFDTKTKAPFGLNDLGSKACRG